MTRSDDARTVLGDRRLAVPGAETAENRGDDSLSQGPPGHTRLRRLVSAAFTHRRVADLRSRVAVVATGLAGAMLARRPTADLMETLGFGVSSRHRRAARRASRRARRPPSMVERLLSPPGGRGRSRHAWERLWAQVGDLITRARSHPGDHLLRALIAVRDTDADRLSGPELQLAPQAGLAGSSDRVAGGTDPPSPPGDAVHPHRLVSRHCLIPVHHLGAPRASSEAVETFIRAGLSFDVADWGDAAAEPVILLHGFPETSASWSAVAGSLAAAGYRALAPDQRGYSPGARPTGRAAYRTTELVDDVLALADAAGADRFHLVGHDWGGIVAWHVGGLHPDRLRTLTVLSTPHPRAFARSLLRSPQALRSWYVLAFQVPGLPERSMLANDGAPLRRALRSSGLDAPAADTYVAAMQQPGAMTAALNWYRALPLGARATAALPSITVPTCYVWSTGDTALDRAAAEATGRYVTGPYRFEVLDGVSHWVPEEAPERVTAMLLEQFRGT